MDANRPGGVAEHVCVPPWSIGELIFGPCDLESQMTKIANKNELTVPARTVPVPTSVSAQAQAMLSLPPTPPPQWPALADPAGWKQFVADSDATIVSMMRQAPLDVSVEQIDADGVTVFIITPSLAGRDDARVYLDLHGGAYVMGGGECCKLMGALTAVRMNMTVWAVDYRMPPDDPYPAALDDSMAAYRNLLNDHRSDEIVVGGSSAGGGLAASLILRARDEGLPAPAAAVLLSPEVDLTESGDTFSTNLGVDMTLTSSLMQPNLLYANDHDLTDPYLSALFGDFAKGFPPTILASGTRDLFLSNTVRLHRKLRSAGVPADLHVLEAAPHNGFIGAPEDEEIHEEFRRFVDIYCPRWRSQATAGRVSEHVRSSGG